LGSDTFPGFNLTGGSPGHIEVSTHMGVLIDPDGSLTLDQVIDSQGGWKAINRSAPNFGFTSDAHWFRFQVNNTTDQLVDRLIELPITFLDDVKFYHLAGGKIKTTYALGDAQPFALRPVRHPNFVMPVVL
jgi:two-component system, sensor histidine kinase LadS